MKVILLQNVDNLGDRNEVVAVKDGYGRNFLIPQGLAVVATKSGIKHAEEITKQQSSKALKLLEDMQAIAEQLTKQVLQVGAKAGASGKLFGSVTNVQLADALKRQMDIDVDRRKIKLTDDIKELGTYKATVELHKNVIADIDFEVVED